MNDRERRYRFYAVTEQEVMELLGNWHHHDFIRLPLFNGLPEGYRVDAAQYDFSRQCWLVRVYHPSFDPVTEIGVIPTFEPAAFRTVDLRTATPI